MRTTDIELLIKSAYSEPPPALEVALPGERARPRRSWPLALAAVLALAVVAAALARSRPADGLADEGDPDLAVVARPPTGVVPETGDWLRVRLTRDGSILVPAGAEWRQVSLDQLAAHLERAAVDFDEKESLEGRSGFERTELGVAASRLRVDLFVDRDAKWVHLQWIMTVCAERKMPRLAFVVGGAGGPFRLDASLPVDAADTPHVKVGVQVVAGTPTRYRFGEEESEELASVARHLEAAKKAVVVSGVARALGEDGKVLRGEIKAGARTPFHEVAKVLAEFRQAGYANVDFYGTAVLAADVRAAAQLPQPATDWPVRKAQEAPGIEEPAAPPEEGR